jgi:uncharacterized repeat protein (TIGR01451 family)
MKMAEQGNKKSKRLTRLATFVTATALLAAILGAPTANAAEPVYTIKSTWADTNLPPGGEGQFTLMVRNVGDADGSGSITVTDQLPAGVTVKGFPDTGLNGPLPSTCSGVGTGTATCTFLAEEGRAQKTGLVSGTDGGVFLGLSPSGFLSLIVIDVEVAPGASGTGTNIATVGGGGASTGASDVDQVSFSGTESTFGLVPGSYAADYFDAEYPFGERERQAGERPFELRTDFDFNAESAIDDEGLFADFFRYTGPHGRVKDVEVTLPRGAVGNPEALPKCDPTDFASGGVMLNATLCPSNTQIGFLNIYFAAGKHRQGYGAFTPESSFAQLTHVPIYNLEPPKGQAVDLAFNAGGLVQGHIYANLDPAQNYAIKTLSPNISALVAVRGTEVTVWGVPADPAHDRWRYLSGESGSTFNGVGFDFLGAPFTAPIKPFLTNPMDCGFDNGGARIRVSSYNNPDQFTPIEEEENPLNVTGCDDPRFRFEPEISMQPTSKAAGGPTGLDVNLIVPQRDDLVSDFSDLYEQNGEVKAIATPPLKKAVVTLPEGMTVSPSAAQGLSSCSPEQIGMGTNSPVTCPDSSQFGELFLKSPILPIDAQPEGWIYVAKPFDNPFHNFLSLYLVIQEPDRGILVKLAGRADLDPDDGQITFTFDDLPQLPVSEATMSVKGGLRAGLVNPQTCGVKTINATLYSWHDPQTPHHIKNNYEITQNPDGSPCYQNKADRPFSPNLAAGTRNNLAGSYSPLDLQLTRTDQEQELDRVEGTAPPGLLASIKGVGRCTDAAIAAAANPERTGTEEIDNPSCPADSLAGTVDAGTGVGQVLTYVPGKLYLAGPYKGAPISGVAIVPAVAGPFDLGNVVTRTPAYINPQTAELHVKTDPLPQIFKGVPVRVRDVQVHLDKNRFTLNPTSCEPFAITGTMFSFEGKSMNGGSRFQAADCASLGFKPRLTTRLFGGTKRGAHPKFKGIYRSREGDANVDSVVVTLPRSEFLDQSHIRTVCTRVQFAADACPAGSIYGHAEAKTPLLDETLRGPVFLRSSNNKLPDLVAELHGIVDVEVVGRIDSIRGGIRASFESVPDVPVESFTITMQGGKKGLLVNSRDICARTYRINAAFKGQNGKETTIRPKLKAKCGKASKAKRAKKAKRAR